MARWSKRKMPASEERQSLASKSALWYILILFGGLNVLFLIAVWCLAPDPDKGEKMPRQPAITTDILIIAGNLVKREPGGLVRKEATQFALDQMAKIINFMFAAASGFLLFIVKILVDPFQKPSSEQPAKLPPKAVNLFVASGLCFISSLLGGILGQGAFPRLATHKTFSLIGDFGISVFYQQMMIFAGVCLMLIAVVPLLQVAIKEEGR